MRTGNIFSTGHAAGLVIALLAFAMLGGCMPRERGAQQTMAAPQRSSQHTARLNVFLTLEEKQGPAVQLEVANIEILNEGLWLPLTSGPMTLDSVAIGDSQLFLGSEAVPPGQYENLRLTVTEGRLRKVDGSQAVGLRGPQSVELSLARGLTLKSGDSETLNLTWDVENTLQRDNSLSPNFFVAPALRTLPTKLVFVTCPDIDTVFVVRKDKNWVADSMGLPGRPTSLAVDPSPGRERLYVLAPGEKMVKVVDLSSYRVVDSYPTLNDEATFMTLSPDGRWAYLLQERSGYVSRMNLRTGQIENRAMLGFRPSFAVYLEEQKLLAVSLSLGQKVLLLDPESLMVVRSISTGSHPEGLLALENQLYVAESDDASISSYDLSNRRGQSRLMVGFGPRRLVDAGNQIFVSNHGEGSLSVLVPGQLGVIQEIYGLGQPLDMVFDPFYRRLYIADEREAGLAVIDANSNSSLGYIRLGAKPDGLAEIQ